MKKGAGFFGFFFIGLFPQPTHFARHLLCLITVRVFIRLGDMTIHVGRRDERIDPVKPAKPLRY